MAELLRWGYQLRSAQAAEGVFAAFSLVANG